MPTLQILSHDHVKPFLCPSCGRFGQVIYWHLVHADGPHHPSGNHKCMGCGFVAKAADFKTATEKLPQIARLAEALGIEATDA